MQESDNLIDTWAGRLEKYLSDLPVRVDRVSSRCVTADLKADKIAPDTWTAITRKLKLRNAPKKESYGELRCLDWTVNGQSFVRISAEAYGFTEEVA